MAHGQTSNKRTRLILSAVSLLLGTTALILWWLWGNGELLPSTKLTLRNVVYACSDANGNLFVTDNECRRVSCISPDGKVQYIIPDVPFEGIGFVTDMVPAGDGGCYVQYLFQNTESYTTKFESICKFNSHGKLEKEVFRMDYQNAENPPHRNNSIFGMTLIGDKLMLMLRSGTDISIVSVDPNVNIAFETGRINAEDAAFMHLLARFISEDQYLFTTADGGVGLGRINGEETVLHRFDYSVDGGGIQPYYIAGDAEHIYINDISGGTIFLVGSDGTYQNISGDFTCSGLYFCQGMLTTISGDSLLMISQNGDCQQKGPVFVKKPILYIPSYLALGCAVAALCLLCCVLISLLKQKGNGIRLSIFVKQILATVPIILAMLAISLNYVSSSVMRILMENMENRVMGFTVLNSDKFNGDEIETLTGYSSLNTDEFNHMHANLQGILNDNKDTWNQSYYTAIYLLRGYDLYLLAISNDSSPNFSYYDTIDESAPEWDAFHDGQSFVNTYSDFEGDWVYAQTPIYNSTGEIVAVLETGADLNAYQLMTENLIWETIGKFLLFFPIFIFCMVAVALLTLRQIRKTSDAVSEIAKGNFNARVDRLSHDEIGDIGRGVNTMAEKLAVSFRNTEQLKDTYFKFVPIQFMQLLQKKSITDIHLGDAVCTDITVLFFDIRAFSKKSEMMTTSENFSFVNAITETAGPIIRKYSGFVDKYIGDAVMALFTDAKSAVDAGIELYQSIVLDRGTFQFGGEEIRIGIGIHSGMSMLGIIGEQERLSSTVISDTVNLASRLESLTKQYATGMIISKDTLDRLSDAEEYNLRFLGMVQVAGVNEIKALYEVLDCLDDRERMARTNTKDVFENGVKKLHLGNCEGALQCFRQVAGANPNDKCIAKYIALAEESLQSPDSVSRVIRFMQK